MLVPLEGGCVTAGPERSSARVLLGSELRRLRQAAGVSQEQLAVRVLHSRPLLARVELGERWPSRDLTLRCDESLGTGGALARLWPLVEHERLGTRRLPAGARLLDVREVVLRLAVLTGTDLAARSGCDEAPGDEQSRRLRDAAINARGPEARGVKHGRRPGQPAARLRAEALCGVRGSEGGPGSSDGGWPDPGYGSGPG